jgi:hypothetical protein
MIMHEPIDQLADHLICSKSKLILVAAHELLIIATEILPRTPIINALHS